MHKRESSSPILLCALASLLFACPGPSSGGAVAVETPKPPDPDAESEGTPPTGENVPEATPPTAAPKEKEKPARAKGVPEAISAEGIPTVPPELTERLFQYQNVRAGAFQSFGPSGEILFSTRFADTSQLHLVSSPKGQREQLTFFEEPVSGGFFLPKTSDIYFLQGKGGDENYQIYRLDRKAGKTVLLSDGKSRHVAVIPSPTGKYLGCTSNQRNGKDMDIWLLDTKSGAKESILEASGETYFISDISADDSKMLAVRYVSATESYPYVIDLKTKEKREIPIPGGVKASHGDMEFSADGKGVYLSSDAASEFAQLAYVDLATLSYKWITDKIAWSVTDIEVGKDRVAFVTNEDGISKLYLLEKGAYKAVDLPSGIISGIELSQDQKKLGFTLSRPDAPGDVYVYDVASKKTERWTYSEVGGLDPSTFVTAELIRYKSFDGREIPAYIFKPKGAKKAPVLVSIHGGPESQYRPYFSGIIQFWVNELGIAVIAPNVRGSAGYGKTYLSLDDVEKREDSVKDIGALLDWVAGQSDLDSSRVAVYGGSYGGYMVLASLVMFGEKIRAGVDIVGIANFTTFFKTSPYRADLRRVEYGDERKPEIKSFFEKISPANNTDKIKSALMVAHGINDPRVPFAEAEQIVEKVRAKGRTVWTVYADNEGHGFARKENRDYLTAATALFLQEHLLK